MLLDVYSLIIGIYKLYICIIRGIVVMVFNATFNTVIGGGNQSTRRKPPTCSKSLKTLSHNVVTKTPRHERDANSQL